MNKLIACTLCLFLSISLMAQRDYSARAEKMASIKAKKIAYITDELSLSPEQAEKFWPLYNEFSEEKIEKREGRRNGIGNDKRKADSDFSSMSDAEAKEYLNELIKKEEEKLQTKKEFVRKLESVLDTKQILQLFRAEKKFKRNIFRDYKKKVRKKEKE